MSNIIEVKNLAKTFRVKQKSAGMISGLKSVFHPNYKETEAVKNLCLNVKEGEILAFIGPNGAGKSTTIKMLTGILYPTSGEINVFGLDPTKQRQQLAFHIGSVFGQKPQLWYHLPAMDSYNLYARIYELDPKAYKQRLDYLVESFEIEDLLKTPVRKLSLGQRMRCEIAASLLHRPRIIFLDEPTIGLDVIAKEKIRKVIKHLNKEEKVTIFLTSHDAGDVEALAKRTVVINFGQIVFDGKTEQLKNKYIKSKIVEIVFEENANKFTTNNGKIIKNEENKVLIEMTGGGEAIRNLVADSFAKYKIRDINVYDPPMEDIIAAIYREKKNG